MIKNTEESKPNFYDVYYQENGKKIIVLEGLSPNDTYEAPILQQTIHQYYGTIELLYWGLFLSTAIYLVSLYVAIPVLRKFNFN
jgi:hypothetical protein